MRDRRSVLSEVRRLPTESRDEARWGLCEIRWFRSYRSGAFAAIQPGDSAEEIARSPKFRWRKSGPAPPESPEIVTCLETLERALVAAGWEPVDRPGGEWCERQYRRRLVPLSERLSAYAVEPDESMLAWLNARTAAPPHEESDARGEDPARVVAIREAARRRELKRLEAERLEAERLLTRHRELERLEAERREQERLQARRREYERLEAERRRAERQGLQGEPREAELETEPAESWSLGYTAKIEPRFDIRASFGVKSTPDSPG